VSTQAVSWLVCIYFIIALVLPFFVGVLGVKVGLRLVKSTPLSLGRAAIFLAIYALITGVLFVIVISLAAAVGVRSPWLVTVLAYLLSGIVFVALLRRRVQTSRKRAAIVFGVTLGAGVLFPLAVVFPMRLLVIAPYRVNGSSMAPSMPDRAFVMVDKISYRLGHVSRGDIAFIRPPFDPSVLYVKRIVGLPGERIQFKGGNVIIYNSEHPKGFVLSEPYLEKGVKTSSPSEDVITISEDSYFVLGDNRANSNDSRFWGRLPRTNVVGRVAYVLLPAKMTGGVATPTYPGT
jgi:signal peptidase I